MSQPSSRGIGMPSPQDESCLAPLLGHHNMVDHKGSTSTGAVTTGVSAKPTIGNYVRWYFELTRLHKFPLGNILIIWPCLWGLTMAAYNTKLPLTQLATQSLVFALGSTLLHSTACVINDICDIEFDRRVERTKNRPLASGLLPVSGAWALWGVGVAGCLALLTMTNRTAAMVGVFDLFPLHALYPLMKRWTYWPQAWLGLAMNWGFMVAWLHIEPVSTPANWYVMIIMLLGTTCWTIVYDTQYACQDRADDAKLGIKSTALLFGENVRPILIGFATVFVLSLVAAGVFNGQTAIYYVVSCGGAAAHLTWQFTTWDVNDVEDCGRKFKSNGDIGYVIWIGMLLDFYLRT